MDSNETIRPLTEVPMEQTSETLVSSSATAEENNATYVPKQTKEEVIERLKEINEDACNADKQELDLLKQNFYKLHKAEQEAARKAFIDGGGAPEAFIPQPDDAESRFKDIMSSIKEKRSAIQAEQDKEKEDNLVKKLAIIDRLKELAESPEDANKAYNEFKKLQHRRAHLQKRRMCHGGVSSFTPLLSWSLPSWAGRPMLITPVSVHLWSWLLWKQK